MRSRFFLFCLALVAVPAFAQTLPDPPRDPKAAKTYQKAMDNLEKQHVMTALYEFQEADNQDAGHCNACQKYIIRLGMECGEWKIAGQAAKEMIAEAIDSASLARAHYQLALVLLDEGEQHHKTKLFTQAHEEAASAMAAYPHFPDALFLDGMALARLHQDQAAKSRFEEFLRIRNAEDPKGLRAERYAANLDLARARRAPPFGVTTTEGKHITLDDLQGKVVLLDFWATWCGPCRAAIPRLRAIAKEFEGQPLVILSVNLDDSERNWLDYLATHDMHWLQCRDVGGLHGPLAKSFGVIGVPYTFMIDADGVLQEERLGGTYIEEDKLKELVGLAREIQAHAPQPVPAPGTN